MLNSGRYNFKPISGYTEFQLFETLSLIHVHLNLGMFLLAICKIYYRLKL